MSHDLSLSYVGQIVIASCSCGSWSSRTAWRISEGQQQAVAQLRADHEKHSASAPARTEGASAAFSPLGPGPIDASLALLPASTPPLPREKGLKARVAARK